MKLNNDQVLNLLAEEKIKNAKIVLDVKGPFPLNAKQNTFADNSEGGLFGFDVEYLDKSDKVQTARIERTKAVLDSYSTQEIEPNHFYDGEPKGVIVGDNVPASTKGTHGRKDDNDDALIASHKEAHVNDEGRDREGNPVENKGVILGDNLTQFSGATVENNDDALDAARKEAEETAPTDGAGQPVEGEDTPGSITEQKPQGVIRSGAADRANKKK